MLNKLYENELKELAYQALMGAIYGGSVAVMAIDGVGKVALIAIGVGVLKGAAHAAVKFFRTKSVSEGMQFRVRSTSEKIDRIL